MPNPVQRHQSPRSWREAPEQPPPATSNAGVYLQQAEACQAAAGATPDHFTRVLLAEEASLWRMLAAQSEIIATVTRRLSDPAGLRSECAV